MFAVVPGAVAPLLFAVGSGEPLPASLPPQASSRTWAKNTGRCVDSLEYWDMRIEKVSTSSAPKPVTILPRLRYAMPAAHADSARGGSVEALRAEHEAQRTTSPRTTCWKCRLACAERFVQPVQRRSTGCVAMLFARHECERAPHNTRWRR
jgi:aldehyde:ferredoxin oxidoreductase